MKLDPALAAIRKYIPRSVFLFFRPAYHFLLAFLAGLRYGFPSRRLIVIGITGTKGKTTVVELAHAALSAAGAKTASLSSLRFRIGDKETKNERKMTMPGRFFVQKFLYDAARAGSKFAVLEVTSEGISQFRHRFIDFRTVLMTGVAPEHIESHGSFERYLRAKLDLFWRMPQNAAVIINADDAHKDRFSAAARAHKHFYGESGIHLGGKLFDIRHLVIDGEGIAFSINGHALHSRLRGEHNFYNIAAVLALGLASHVSLEQMIPAIEKVTVIPGRLEFIQQQPFAIAVDYAHTPDSLAKVYGTLRAGEAKNSRLICVLGAAGGGRDSWKRPEFGKIAAESCDEIILTNEDPYDEDPGLILSEIESGILNFKFSILKILDRREAIRHAIASAKEGDAVIITGKGAEPWIMGPNGEKIPWDDREVAREELLNISEN